MKDRERRLMGCIGGIDDELVMEASVVRLRRSNWGTWAALAACMILVITLPMTLGRSEGQPADKGPMLESEATAEEPLSDESPALLYREVADESIMGLTLGMSSDDIRTVLGAPSRMSNSGPITFPDGSTRVCWFYEDLKLDLVDVGEGWFLNHIMASSTGWTLSTSIGVGSTREEAALAYPQARIHGSEAFRDEESIQQEAWYVAEGLELFLEEGRVKHVLLGPLIQEPPETAWELTTTLPYDLTTDRITITVPGMESVSVRDRAAKRICTILTISEPEEGEPPPIESPASWLIMHNGTVLELLGEDWAAVYTYDSDDPYTKTYHLTGRFPGLDDAVAQALADPDAGWD